MHPNETDLNDYVEGTLGAAERADVERHLAACDACRALVDDLQAVRSAAAGLEPRDAPARAWSRLERAIRFEQESRAAHGGTREPGARASSALRTSWTWLAAAAAILVAVFVGVKYRPAPAPEAARTEATAGAPATDASDQASVEAELRAAEEHYDKAIRGLEQITNSEKGALDTQTAATLQKNLSVIDQAISESRAAVRAQPASQPAQDSLIESFKAKLALLQDTVALINEMRKGNEAGAARIGSGLTKKG
ncbi:MAG TPA: zf-HC2 domain-containing protein [Vicinamibacterales bacterium]|nr:zf-HC2 domain-containing protein [Vicinamibacterales bacterium]